MTLEKQSSLILSMEKRLGRPLSGDERRLILLAEDLMDEEQKDPGASQRRNQRNRIAEKARESGLFDSRYDTSRGWDALSGGVP